mmetsp:Transcript_75746/g.215776  ORF Transcript_75746/g.215776 Transcript_75746/m.215776 type:complete len:442 (-) Transcript_75746:436-1761(-)
MLQDREAWFDPCRRLESWTGNPLSKTQNAKCGKMASCTEPLSTAPALPAVAIPPALRPTNRSISALNFVSYLTATNTPVVFHRVAVPVFALRPAELPAELTPLACGEDEAASANFRCDSLLWREASTDRISLHQLISFHTRNLLNFGNGMDHIALTHLLRRATKGDPRKEDFCSNSAAPWLIAGVSWGQLTSVVVEHCPGLNVHGFEIQREEAAKAAARFRDSHSGVIIHAGVGLSEAPMTAQVRVPTATPTHAHVVEVGDGGRWEGGVAVEAVGGGTLTTTLVSPAEWADEEGIGEFSYVVLDTEGHEASVIRGMHLEQERNRKRFPVVQFELGGTWAVRDPRRLPTEMWTQFDAASFMAYAGYDLYLVGDVGWLPVPPSFFDLGERPKESRWNDEGHGLFVQGTVLCVQRTHAPAALRRVVWSSAASLLGIIAGFYGVE